MHAIEIDDDVNQYLLQKTRTAGESVSDILRREFGLPNPGELKPQPGAPAHELTDALDDPHFIRNSAAVDRFLYLLGAAYKQKGTDFEKVLAIQGRERRYFAKSREEIEESGKSTQPRNIKNSPYWVMTNSPTPQKRQILADALKLLGYSETSINAATARIS